MIDYYQNRRQEEKRARHHKIAAVFFGIVAVAVLAGAYWFMRSQASEIKDFSVNISGSGDDLKKDVENIFYDNLGNLFFSKIFSNGKNIILADIYKDRITSDIQNKLPLIKDLSVHINVFNRTVSVGAATRERYAIWCVENQNVLNSGSGPDNLSSECFWFDGAGFVFGLAPSTEGQLIYKVLDSSGAQVSMGKSILSDNEPANLIAMFELMDNSGFSYRTLYIKDKQLEEITSNSSIKPVFWFSLRNNPSYALQALQSLGTALKKASYIDLRVPNRIYYQ